MGEMEPVLTKIKALRSDKEFLINESNNNGNAKGQDEKCKRRNKEFEGAAGLSSFNLEQGQRD